ncbi:VWA domain-containing protein [Hydrogenimonas sp.]
MEFVYPYLLILLASLPVLWILAKKGGESLRRRFTPELYRKMVRNSGWLGRGERRLLLLAAMALAIVALARPVVDRGEIKVEQETIDLVVAFDISRSMFSDDVYPNRFELAKRKFFDLLDVMKDARIGVIGFSSRAFLVSPLTHDFASLGYLVKHMGLEYVSLKGTDMMAPLEVTQALLKDRDKKALLIFTDGGDTKDFSKEIEYARRHGIRVFVYAIGTKKGGVMKTQNGVIRDENGDIVITRLNPAVKELAQKTGGVYMPFSLSSGDMRQMAEAIRQRVQAQKRKSHTIRDREELFYYPLALSLLLFWGAWISPPRRRGEMI